MLGKALLGTGVGAVAVGMGAAAGAYSAQTEGNAMQGAIVGGGVGLGLGVGAVAVGANAGNIASGLGKGAMSLGKKAYTFATSEAGKKVAMGALNGVKTVGAGTAAVGIGAVKAVTPVATTMALKAGAKYGNIAASMFEINPAFLAKESGRMLNLTKRGAALIGVGTVGSMVAGGVKAFNTAKAGASDGQITTATPNGAAYSMQMRDAGATGDLAFAMRAQRNG